MEIIAEVGVHHEGSVDKACKYIESLSGVADAVKFQLYDADTLCQIDSPVYWDTKMKTQYEVFSQKERMSLPDWIEIRDYAAECGLKFYMTPFSLKYVDWCDKLNVDAIKIASAEITYKQLLDKINSIGGKVYMSTGGATTGEIYQAFDSLAKCDVTPLHCSLIYPSTVQDARLGRFGMLKTLFPYATWGYSCHVKDNWEDVAIGMRVLGAKILEKHYTLTPNKEGDDHYHSATRESFLNFRRRIEQIEESLDEDGIITKEENITKKARRSLCLTKDVPCGIIINEDDLTALRPNNGLSPMFYKEFIGKALVIDKKKGDLLKWKDVKPV